MFAVVKVYNRVQLVRVTHCAHVFAPPTFLISLDETDTWEPCDTPSLLAPFTFNETGLAGLTTNVQRYAASHNVLCHSLGLQSKGDSESVPAQLAQMVAGAGAIMGQLSRSPCGLLCKVRLTITGVVWFTCVTFHSRYS